MSMQMSMLPVSPVEKDLALPYTAFLDEQQQHHMQPQQPVVRSSAIDRSKFKTKLCKNWASGTECPYGARCVFAHGKHEKRDDSEVMQSDSESLVSTTPLDSTLSRSDIMSPWDLSLEVSTPSVMSASAPAYYPSHMQVYQEPVIQYQQQELYTTHIYVTRDPTPSCYRYEPYGEVVTRVPVAVPIPLTRTATNESQGLTDVSSEY
eukprot:TRINITY_DN1964_c0_g1_i2.p1 TRINITY_DN1964_c0_g1~~TRINITY_DN1964_c0_g1_i2.p1  ORF type:complete len:224 (+),score=62.76 TRINITY_DN1964_c0_g1_i2:56-673(+)